MTPSCLVFLHLPKTAGSTLSTVLRWQYRHLRPDQVLRLTDRGVDQIDSLPPGRRADLRVVMGHFPYGLHEHLPIPARYITIVRDPVRRVISTYRYVLARDQHPLHHAVVASGMTFADYVRSGVHHAQVENALTRQLAGRYEDDDDITERDAEVASENLRGFVAVGVTERFDESLILLKRRLGWRTPFYFSRNVSDRGPRPDDVPEDVLQLVRDRNTLDLRLWELAREKFSSDVRAEGTGFEREVARFQRWNRAPRAIGRLLEPVAPRFRGMVELRAAYRARR